MIRAIAARELRSLFFSPLAWTMLAVVQVIVAYLFLAQVDFFLQIQPRLPQMPGAPGLTEIVVAPTFGSAALILLLVVPMLTMRLISDELRNQTLSLLFSAPVSMTEIILGKYCGVLGYLLIQLLLIALLPCALLLGGSLDVGILASGLLGLLLLLAGFAAVGLFMSTLTAQPVIAAISTFGVLLLLWIIDWSGAAGSKGASVFGYLSMLRHYESLLKGVFNSTDVVYYLLLIALFIILSIRRLDSYRLQH
ncbi:MAG: ABC transporter permease subunit [Gammaproteobacteria bacterium]|nr:ABC transporter permease subunit [Gammaproteobacteria bacterium]